MSKGLPRDDIDSCLLAVSLLLSGRAASNFAMIAISVDRYWVIKKDFYNKINLKNEWERFNRI